MEKVGKDGVITVEEGKTTETTLEFVEGMQFDKGYISPYFINRPAEMDCRAGRRLILIHEKKISNLRDLVPLLEKVAQSGKPLLIIAEDVDGEALTALVVNKLRGVLNVCAVKAPGFGDRRKAMLGDIAVLTGGTLISEDLGIKLENLQLEHLGRAKQITVDKDDTTIVEGAGKQAEIQNRIAADPQPDRRTPRASTTSEKFQERLAKLTGGVAIISVGAATEADMKQKKARVEDALHATRAAVEEGILPGGGVALLRCTRSGREGPRRGQGRREDRRRHRAAAPWRPRCGRSPTTAASTARWSPTKCCRSRPTSATTPTPASTSTCSRPASSTRSRWCARPCSNAASIAGLMLTTEALVTNLDKDDKAKNRVEGSVR